MALFFFSAIGFQFIVLTIGRKTNAIPAADSLLFFVFGLISPRIHDYTAIW
jgi:hypothetical protein